MADKSIGELPAAEQLYDDSLIPMEQGGQAKSVSGQILKNYAKQGVEAYVEAAQTAASAANKAVSQVGSSVEDAQAAASRAEAAAIHQPIVQGGTWWTWDPETGAYTDSGQPAQGPTGDKGDQGDTGPEGPQGPQGTGLTVLGQYDTQELLEAAVPAPEIGDNYYVGAAAPYDVYTCTAKGWVNGGPLQGAQGPEGPKGDQGEPGPAGPAGATGADGADGASAYGQAVSAGYTGTEAEFYAALVTLQNAPFLPLSGGTVTGNVCIKGFSDWSERFEIKNGIVNLIDDSGTSAFKMLTDGDADGSNPYVFLSMEHDGVDQGPVEIYNVATPGSDYSVANKKYVDDAAAGAGGDDPKQWHAIEVVPFSADSYSTLAVGDYDFELDFPILPSQHRYDIKIVTFGLNQYGWSGGTASPVIANFSLVSSAGGVTSRSIGMQPTESDGSEHLSWPSYLERWIPTPNDPSEALSYFTTGYVKGSYQNMSAGKSGQSLFSYPNYAYDKVRMQVSNQNSETLGIRIEYRQVSD